MRNKISAILVVGFLFGGVVFLCGCSKKARQKIAPADPPMTDYIRFEYGVYMMPVHKKDPQVVLRRALNTQFPRLKLVEQLPSEPQVAIVEARFERDAQHEYAPPSLESLKYSGMGLTDQEKKDLRGTQEAFILVFAHPKEDVWTALHAANDLIETVARETGGLVWDEETREVYSPDAWHKQRIGEWKEGVPNISTQMVIHIYENGEYLRAISLGMSKAGLPDAVIQELPETSAKQAGDLIDFFVQTVAEGRALPKTGQFKLDLRAIQNASLRDPQLKSLKSNGTGVACLTLREAAPEEGDPKNRLVELSFDSYSGKDRLAREDAAVSLFFGREDTLTQVEHTDQLLEESSKEKSKLPMLHRNFDSGLRPGEYILVKAPFKTPDGGNEWMWVEVRSWNGDKIKGVLENDPENVPGLQAGQIVEVQESGLFDYIRHYPDGHEEGNTTGAVMRENNRGERAVATTTSPPACED